jgi:hypothetical protein
MPAIENVNTPIPVETPESEDSILASTMAKECLKIVDTYRKGPRKPIGKASAIHEITGTLTAATPQLTEDELNDALGTYLKIIEQHDRAVMHAMASANEERSETERETPIGSKRGATPGADDGPSKKPKTDDSDFPWVVRGQLGQYKLSPSLEATLTLLRAFA